MFPSCEVIYTAFPWSDRKSKVFTKKTEKLWTPKIVENSTNYGIHLSRIVIILSFLPEYPQKKTMFIPSDEHDAALIKKNQPPEKSLLLFIFYMYVNIL